MILYWVLGIGLVVWIVKEITRKQSNHNPEGHGDTSHNTKDKEDHSCCH